MAGGLALLKWPLRILVLVVFGVFVYLVISVVQVLTASQVSQLPSAVAPAAAVVVMAPSASGAKLSTDATNRLEQALSLYEAKRAPIVVVAGPDGSGNAAGPVSKSAMPAASTVVGAEIRFLEQQGMPLKDIYDAGGSSDLSGLTAVGKIVGTTDGKKVILVADPLSSLRLRATATAVGLVPEISPGTPPAASFWDDVGQVWKQASAVAVGRVFGYSSTGWASS